MGFWLTLAAGLTTAVGGALALVVKNTRRFVPVSLGLAAGSMVYVSFVELLPEAFEKLALSGQGQLPAVAAFFVGILLIVALEHALPDTADHLGRAGVLTIVAVILHNLPEGLAMYVTAETNMRLGVTVALAIALHNIPEGIAIAAPLYASGKSARYAFLAAVASGLVEPLGALLGMGMAGRISPVFEALLLAFVAGMMVSLVFAELLPTANKKDEAASVYALIAGMAITAAGLLLA